MNCAIWNFSIVSMLANAFGDTEREPFDVELKSGGYSVGVISR